MDREQITANLNLVVNELYRTGPQQYSIPYRSIVTECTLSDDKMESYISVVVDIIFELVWLEEKHSLTREKLIFVSDGTEQSELINPLRAFSEGPLNTKALHQAVSRIGAIRDCTLMSATWIFIERPILYSAIYCVAEAVSDGVRDEHEATAYAEYLLRSLLTIAFRNNMDGNTQVKEAPPL